MGSPRVSVVLPFHSHAHGLSEAVQSLSSQTEANTEMILVNNNAHAPALALARQLADSDARIKVVDEPRQGIAFALNTGLKYARAQYIARLDADDLAHPDRIKLQADFLDEHPEIGLVSCRAIFVSTVEKNEGFARFVEWQNSIITPQQHAQNRFVDAPVAHPTVMFRANLLHQYGNYNTSGVPEDYELWLRWLEAGVQMAKMENSLVTWADHPTRLSRTHSDYSHVAFMKTRLDYLCRWLKANVPDQRPILLCAGRRHGLIDEFESRGVSVFGISDLKLRKVAGVHFVSLEESLSGRYFLVSLIAKRGVRDHMRQLFAQAELNEGHDFILAG